VVLVSPALNPQACWEFEGEILVLHHPTTISTRYQAMVHCGSIRQTASILGMSMECLRTGDRATVHFRFMKQPEYIKVNQRLVFREGRTKAVGNITKLMPLAPSTSSHGVKIKPIKNQPKPQHSNPYPNPTQDQQSTSNNPNAINTKNENVAPTSTIATSSAENDASSSLQPESNLTELTAEPGQQKKRNKRGGKRHTSNDSNGATSTPRTSIGGTGPLAEANAN